MQSTPFGVERDECTEGMGDWYGLWWKRYMIENHQKVLFTHQVLPINIAQADVIPTP